MDEELPYPSIVGLNEHAATLHYQHRDRQPPRRSLSLLIDAGASCRGYGSDITRTWAMGPGAFAGLVDGMHELQQELCEAVAPGVDWRELHLTAHRLVARLLHAAGVLKIKAEEAVERGISATFLPHGLGHLLGLQVHDVGGFKASADGAPIARPPGHPALRHDAQARERHGGYGGTWRLFHRQPAGCLARRTERRHGELDAGGKRCAVTAASASRTTLS
ncbi:MAG: M24 family metallopeptidase [Pseudomonadota bacterium]